MDAASLSLLDGVNVSSKSSAAKATTTTNNVVAPITDYELSQIVIVPTSDWDSNSYGIGSRYDVHDGQQRLVILNLLLAYLRDSFLIEANELHRGGGGNGNSGGMMGGGKRAVALFATAQEIAGMLMPTKVRKLDVRRITLRKRDNVILEQILMGVSTYKQDDDDDDDDDEDSADDKEEDRGVNINGNIHGVDEDPWTSLLPSETHQYSQMSTRQKSLLLSNLSPANSRIFHNFVHLSKRLATLSTRERLRLLDYIVERVHLLVCVPETSRIARNIVLNQQGRRKGMDNEPIDDFKGLVCFRYTLEEEDMYRTFDAWDVLAADGSVATATAAGGTAAGVEAAAAILMLNGLGDVVVAGGCPPLHSGLDGFGSGFRCGLAHDVALLLRYQFQHGVSSLMLITIRSLYGTWHGLYVRR